MLIACTLKGSLWQRWHAACSGAPTVRVCSDMFSGGLWRRAARAGCSTAEEKRAFGAADDVYAAGLVVAFLCFVPFCKPGAVDGGALQRLIETTFALDFDAIRCASLGVLCSLMEGGARVGTGCRCIRRRQACGALVRCSPPLQCVSRCVATRGCQRCTATGDSSILKPDQAPTTTRTRVLRASPRALRKCSC